MIATDSYEHISTLKYTRLRHGDLHLGERFLEYPHRLGGSLLDAKEGGWSPWTLPTRGTWDILVFQSQGEWSARVEGASSLFCRLFSMALSLRKPWERAAETCPQRGRGTYRRSRGVASSWALHLSRAGACPIRAAPWPLHLPCVSDSPLPTARQPAASAGWQDCCCCRC